MKIRGTQGSLRAALALAAFAAGVVAVAFSVHLVRAAGPQPVQTEPARVAAVVPFIEVHSHLANQKNAAGSIEDALQVMPVENAARTIFMPSPFAIEQPNRFDCEVLRDAEKYHRDKFAFLGGGGTLNVMIQQVVQSGNVSLEMKKEFKDRAEAIIREGASGFGEMTTEHFAMNARGFYEYAPNDHPLLEMLLDISA